MSTLEPFQRARKPEQKEERRLHLLDTARAALQGGLDVSELGLNELARRAAMTKSNVYRYFENREELLLALLEEESERWADALCARLAATQDRSPEHVAKIFAGIAAASPLMCRLLSILPSIIEHNVSRERLTQFKRNAWAMTVAVIGELRRGAPAMPLEACAAFMRQLLPLLIGLWPLSQPREALAEVLLLPEMQPFRYDFEADFAAGLTLLLRGLAPAQAA